MFKLFLNFALMALAVAQYTRPLVFRPRPERPPGPNSFYPNTYQYVNMCTYSDVSYEKCLHTVAVAHNNSINLGLKCIRQEDRENCINSVRNGASDVVVLTAHGYKAARNAGLKPVIFGKEDDKSLYIAVAPRNITFLGIQEAPIYFDQSKHRAFHAATYFNFRMGHEICSFLDKASLTEYITIVDSAEYVPNSEEVLVCPNRIPDEFKNYKTCNVEAGLQRAVFVRSNLFPTQEHSVRQLFDTITQKFGPNSKYFNFFGTFQGEDDVIFKNDTVSLDLTPTYRNQVDEKVFNYLHCNQDDQPHDNRVLL